MMSSSAKACCSGTSSGVVGFAVVCWPVLPGTTTSGDVVSEAWLRPVVEMSEGLDDELLMPWSSVRSSSRCFTRSASSLELSPPDTFDAVLPLYRSGWVQVKLRSAFLDERLRGGSILGFTHGWPFLAQRTQVASSSSAHIHLSLCVRQVSHDCDGDISYSLPWDSVSWIVTHPSRVWHC